ncbi:hypothetical protein QSH57_000048 [Fusarium oxysporum f. sp. vasinfectum]|nr:hypothetical protein QSH57_000048 [Fusarium oxysporum f. sp. vasinfectum]
MADHQDLAAARSKLPGTDEAESPESAPPQQTASLSHGRPREIELVPSSSAITYSDIYATQRRQARERMKKLMPNLEIPRPLDPFRCIDCNKIVAGSQPFTGDNTITFAGRLYWRLAEWHEFQAHGQSLHCNCSSGDGAYGIPSDQLESQLPTPCLMHLVITSVMATPQTLLR